MTSSTFQAAIATALGLDAETDENTLIDRVAALARSEESDDSSDLGLIKLNFHPRVKSADDGKALLVELLCPIKSGSEVIRILAIKKPTFGHLRKAEELALRNSPRVGKAGERLEPGTVARSSAMISIMTGRSVSELDELDPADLATISAAIAFFMQQHPATGPK